MQTNNDDYPVEMSKKYIPPAEDILKFLNQANELDRCYLLLIIHTLARIREINNLKWSDVHEEYSRYFGAFSSINDRWLYSVP